MPSRRAITAYKAALAPRTIAAARFGFQRCRLGMNAARTNKAAPSSVPISDVQAENRSESMLSRAQGIAAKTRFAHARNPSPVARTRSSVRSVARKRPKTRNAASSAIMPQAVSIVAWSVGLR